jgi:putative DNA primase/helicase
MQQHTTGANEISSRKDNNLNGVVPVFDFSFIDEVKAEKEKLLQSFEPIPHKEILHRLLQQVESIDFREKAGLRDETEKLQRKHFIVCTVDEMLDTAKRNQWQLCRNNGQTFIYNGVYWKAIDRDLLHSIFGEAAEKMGVPHIDARHYLIRREFILQFESIAYLPAPERNTGTTLINLINGTYVVTAKEQYLRPPAPDDFITYQLPFAYSPGATAPLFYDYLNTVQPDKERQEVLQEYLGYVFISPQTLKLEKVLLLYGGGANGKSVFIEIINALLGRENVSSYSLQTLTEPKGYTRAELATKLLNCASELSGKMENNVFKELASGEAVEARIIYQRPFIMENYAKLLFSTNELPKEVEQTSGYFRRWLIVPFDVTIPENEQDKELAQKIIANELTGVFNWVLEGLKRLLIQKKFTECTAVLKQMEDFKKQSDSVQMFLEDAGYQISLTECMPLQDLFNEYRTYCSDNGYYSCAKNKFSQRLRNIDFVIERKNYGNVVFAEK